MQQNVKRLWKYVGDDILLCEGGSGLSYTSVGCMPGEGG
jgi:hypothetical protein